MIDQMKKVLGIKSGYMSWSEYQDKVEFMSQLKWQQDVRKQSVKNSAAPGGLDSKGCL